MPEGLYAHRALYDCYVTAELLMYMGREAQWTIREMREISASPSLLYRIRFGKHKGKTFEEVSTEDKGYLRWLLGTDLDEDMEFTVKHWLKGA